MSTPTYSEVAAKARPGRAFANGTEGYGWMENWCSRCVHDAPFQRDEADDGCNILAVSIFEKKIPAEWLDGPRDEQGRYSIADQYTCVYFRDEDDGGGGEPEPVPDPPGMDALWPRERFEGVRMLTTYPEPTRAEVAS